MRGVQEKTLLLGSENGISDFFNRSYKALEIIYSFKEL